MATRSARLISTNTAGLGAIVALGAVPAATTWIVKEVDIRNTSGFDMATVAVYARDPAGLGTISFFYGPLANNARIQFQGFVVCDAGSGFTVFQSGDGLAIWISGAKLPGVA